MLSILSDFFVGVTGDQSFVRALSFGKLVSYEGVAHKERFISGYLEKIQQESGHQDVYDLAKFLMKRRWGPGVQYDYKMMEILLSKPEVVDELRKINRKIVDNNMYIERLDQVIKEIFQLCLARQQPKSELIQLTFFCEQNGQVQLSMDCSPSLEFKV